MITQVKKYAKRLLKPSSIKPVLGDQPYGGPESSPITFVMVCRQGFNINIPNANSTIRLGFCRGFAQIGVRYQLVSVWELKRTLPQIHQPFVFLSVFDYLDFGRSTRKVLQRYPHFVWGQPDFEIMQKTYAKFNYTYSAVPEKIYSLVLDSEPNFVMAPVPPSALEFYSSWQGQGLRLESVPLACDTTRYYPEPDKLKYSDVKLAFVGGYWPKKAIQFDKYLRPYEDILSVYGYSRWPYSGYGGLLPESDERVLYQNARICPALSEPHAEVMGDIVERPFKIMGSWGFAIMDVVPFYRDLFEPDELLVPSTVEEYHDLVRQALKDKDFNARYRQKGYEAVLARHTYAHRARSILSKLDIKWEVKQNGAGE